MQAAAGLRPAGQPRAAVPTQSLLVAQGFDGIEARGFDGGQHAADDADEAEDHRRPDQRGGVNVEMDIAFAGVFDEGAPQGERAYTPGDEISQDHAQQAAQ